VEGGGARAARHVGAGEGHTWRGVGLVRGSGEVGHGGGRLVGWLAWV
jgi:hypothetical protein